MIFYKHFNDYKMVSYITSIYCTAVKTFNSISHCNDCRMFHANPMHISIVIFITAPPDNISSNNKAPLHLYYLVSSPCETLKMH